MEEEKRKIYTVVAVVVVLGLVFSCILGALAGGAAGYLVGRRQARQVARQVIESERPFRPEILETPSIPPMEPPAPIPAPATTGALIVRVILDSPAERAGLRAGDIILAVDRTQINAAHPLDQVIAGYKPGDVVTIRFWRAGREDSVRVTLAEQPQQAGSPYLGIRFRMLTGD